MLLQLLHPEVQLEQHEYHSVGKSAVAAYLVGPEMTKLSPRVRKCSRIDRLGENTTQVWYYIGIMPWNAPLCERIEWDVKTRKVLKIHRSRNRAMVPPSWIDPLWMLTLLHPHPKPEGQVLILKYAAVDDLTPFSKTPNAQLKSSCGWKSSILHNNPSPAWRLYVPLRVPVKLTLRDCQRLCTINLFAVTLDNSTSEIAICPGVHLRVKLEPL